MHRARRTQADDMGETGFGTIYLTVSGLAPQGGGDLVDIGYAGGSQRVTLGEQFTAHVYRCLPIPPGAARSAEPASATGRAQLEIVVVGEFGR